jgi:hypothetical protein
MDKFITLALATLIGCATQTVSQEESFSDDVASAQVAYQMPAAWATWMIERTDVWARAYAVGTSGKTTWRLNVVYDAPMAYTWATEADHFAALESVLTLAYPGWTFTIGANLTNPDRTLHLGHAGRSEAEGNDIYLVWEGIIVHEFGHTVGLNHHYVMANGEPLATPDTLPPGESDCVMSRNGSGLGQTEQFLLRVGPADKAALASAIASVNAHQKL